MALSAHTHELDAALCAVAPRIKVLSRLSWPEQPIQEFLQSWRRGEPHVPEVTYPKDPIFQTAIAELERIVAAADPDDPVEAYVQRTARSYSLAAQLLDAAGTPRFLELSREIYGDPLDTLPGTEFTHFEAARHLLKVTAPLRSVCTDETHLVCVTSETVQRELQTRTDPFFGEHKLQVVIDSNLAAKAAASYNRIRIRARVAFTEADIDQLLEHEAFVHSATALNGRLQPIQCMGLSAPRTTATQEGLATVAELVTGSMDLSRLRRLALRIGAVRHAIAGADFVEIFRFFLRAGQSEEESVRSTVRVFRGGNPHGHVAFTKDVVYLHGMIGVHTFLRRAISEHRVELIARLFAGRVTASDVLKLEPAFESGELQPGRFIAPWAADPRRLAATLCFSLVLNRINLGDVQLESILER